MADRDKDERGAQSGRAARAAANLAVESPAMTEEGNKLAVVVVRKAAVGSGGGNR